MWRLLAPPAVTKAEPCLTVPPATQHMLEISKKEVMKRLHPLNQAIRATNRLAGCGGKWLRGGERGRGGLNTAQD